MLFHLPNFSELGLFAELKKKMGIPVNYIPDYNPSVGTITEVQWNDVITKGLDINMEELVRCDDGTLEWEGRAGEKVVIYIRDQSGEYSHTYNYKFHVAWCSTLEGMFKQRKYNRYVISQRLDGKFLVHIIIANKVARKEEQSLSICKNCLTSLNYKNYGFSNSTSRDVIYINFSLEEYFNKYRIVKIPIIPQYTQDTAPVNQYVDNWTELSKKIRILRKWRCSVCGADKSREPMDLHVHHIDSNKLNNNPSNLQVLCMKCHAEQHPHMKG